MYHWNALKYWGLKNKLLWAENVLESLNFYSWNAEMQFRSIHCWNISLISIIYSTLTVNTYIYKNKHRHKSTTFICFAFALIVVFTIGKWINVRVWLAGLNESKLWPTMVSHAASCPQTLTWPSLELPINVRIGKNKVHHMSWNCSLPEDAGRICCTQFIFQDFFCIYGG